MKTITIIATVPAPNTSDDNPLYGLIGQREVVLLCDDQDATAVAEILEIAVGEYGTVSVYTPPRKEV